MTARAPVRRMLDVQTPVIPVVSRWIAETPGTISLGQGIVSWGPPAEAIDALRAFPSDASDNIYGPVEGLPELLRVIEQKLQTENRISRSESRVMVTAGGNQAFMNALLAITNPGDEVILQQPYYFNNEMAIVMAGCTPVAVPTTADYQLQPDAIAAAVTPRTRAIVTISPNNPTGAVHREADLRAVNAICRDRGLYHISDEVYEYFVYGGAKHFSPGSIEGAGEWTISLFSLSKAYGMASWRVGYMAVPDALWDSLLKIQDTIVISATTPTQRAAVAAMTVGRDFLAPHLARLARVRERARATLETVADVPRADGAFYYLIRARTSLDSMAATERLIRDHRIAVVPGSAFGATGGCALRVSFGALDESTAGEGLERLANGLRALR